MTVQAKFKRVPDFHIRATLFEVTYEAQGLIVKGYLCIPQGTGPFPVLIYCRGGIKSVGMTRLAWVSKFVDQGCAVFAPFYRGNRGGQGREDFAGEDRFDVIDALPWIKDHPLLEADRIHLFGFSRGSLMALFTAMADPTICSVVVWGGVSDLALTYEERVDLRRMLKRVLGGTPLRKPEEYRIRSPIYDVQRLKCPVLIIHGTEDIQVGVEHSYILAEALRETNKCYTLRIYENQGHFFQPDVYKKAIDDMFTWMQKQEGRKHG
ncbi:alpha/beta hydrolase family protein [Bacillus horti]|uniref:Dipeptidyl aminopeptidase/acylaminoacyl peptidase n=1 Tax=Caldalkalibacillus horti TaxID=77523 RepID=A0ABT9W2D6_9BACI|nr:prolyl oligopeptidase family serine peptidase [Bacillus horti]MDQ0167399.1 dipeptidyl aminopeptidase/acylaminoacyl peptidase [Bacillus horti]